MRYIGFVSFLFVSSAFAITLQEFSQNLNKELPENYDHATRLVSTSVENNYFYYHFMLKANHEEFKRALPMVQSQITKTICSKPRERSLLKDHKATIVYKYENDKGQSLGEFMVKPEHCH